ncbi:secretion protein HlyD [Sphaerisporangium siamense]|uniref:Macrolide-specific efflux system membrane fusion protein n=1 Tax=Sphaerisporangium siamense TaxID=795645 RepID=A0A7W7D550_9ACTN|nr:biotin/lipoyl-binding protein [Sphaerisporangium siamense]MBB4700487.1 macrolide-specific efflux system membrane fusion protein [Sphaerisporangium siamense]GII88350.1 secretion protein HlyD [Sphaerisporangium siamense]
MKLSTKRRALIVNGALAVVLLGGAGVAYASLNQGTAAEATPQTTRVVRGTVLSAVSASGSVESARTRSLDFGTSGTVEKIYVEAGDKVTKDQILARIDDTAARDALDAAQASLDAAEDGDTTTASGYSQYIQARNSYREARRAVNATVIKAPFGGMVTAVNGTVGGSSSGSGSSGSSGSSDSSGGAGAAGGSSGGSSGSGFIELADAGRLQLVGDFTEADVTKLKKGRPATVTFDALPGVTASGKVTRIDPVAQTSDNVVQYAATISLSDVPATVRLGQTASVQVVVAKADDALTVPTSAIRTAGGQSTVTVLENGRQVAKRVEVGVKGDTTAEITAGLSEGDQVVRATGGTSGGSQGGFPGGGFPGGGLTGGVRVGGAGGGGR